MNEFNKLAASRQSAVDTVFPVYRVRNANLFHAPVAISTVTAPKVTLVCRYGPDNSSVSVHIKFAT